MTSEPTKTPRAAPTVQSAAEEVRRLLGDQAGEPADDGAPALESATGFQILAIQIEQARKREGLSIKDLVAELRVSQQRIRHIEHARVQTVDPGALRRLIGRFQLEEVYADWRREHPEIDAEIQRRRARR